MKTTVEKLQQLVGHIRIGQWKFAAYYVRFAAERIAAEYAKVERDADGPHGGRLGFVEALQDPLGRHALERALELAKRLAAQTQVGRRAKVDYFY